MRKQLASKDDNEYEWIDLVDPGREELQGVADEFDLHEASVHDSMEADHLPKYEHLKGHTFTILRIYTGDRDLQADTVKELTDKIAVFVSSRVIITIHKKPWDKLDEINEKYVKPGECRSSMHVLNEIVKEALRTYDQPADKLTRAIEHYEELVFLKDRKKPILKGLYFLKRKVDVIHRVLLLSFDVIDNIDPVATSTPYSRDIRDIYIKQQSVFDALSANTNHLLSIYFNIAAQKTNETIRVLTIFSVFFMPLTFIVGVYGMNFKFMPELNWRYGYPLALLLMGVVVVGIYWWFKKKGWL